MGGATDQGRAMDWGGGSCGAGDLQMEGLQTRGAIDRGTMALGGPAPSPGPGLKAAAVVCCPAGSPTVCLHRSRRAKESVGTAIMRPHLVPFTP